MDIKATQLKNTQATAVADTTATRTPAKVTETGASFIDELSSMTNLGTENKVENKQQTPETTKASTKETSKGETFEFVSTSGTFADKLKKENLTQSEKQVLRQNAEKELVDEIVLMNKKDIKNSKTELKTAQASVSQKSDKQIEAEKQDAKASQDLNNEVVVMLPQETNKNENKATLQAPQEFEQTDKIDLADKKDDLKISDKIDFADKNEDLKISDKSETITQLPQDVENKVILDTKAPLENIVTNETKDIDTELNVKNNVNIGKVDTTKIAQNDKIDEKIKDIKPEIEQNVEKINLKDVKVADKISNEEIEILPDENTTKIAQNKTINKEIKPEIEQNIEKINSKDVKVVDKMANEEIEILPDKNTTKAENKFDAPIEPDFDEKFEPVMDKNFISKISKDKKAESIVNDKKQPIISNEIDDIQNVDNLKNITKDIDVKGVAEKPVATEEMTVIKFEPITTPVIELDKSLNSSRTSDIVKFLDANLTTNSTNKTSKASATKSASEKSTEKTIKMTETDAKFFNNLIESNQQVIEGTKTADSTTIKDVEEAQSVQVSKSLLNALKESQENNKSFRVDFDKDLSVILRVNKDGKISAEFLPGDKVVEQYLKANIPLLQQQFKDEGLEYENLSYRQSKKDDEDKQKQNNRNNKKENGYE